MAGELNVGTLSGRIELEDQMSPAMGLVISKLERMDERITSVGRQVRDAGKAHQEAGGHVRSFGDEFSSTANKIVAGLVSYEGIKRGLEFIGDAVQGAAALERLRMQTDLEGEALQRLVNVGQDFGVEQEQMAAAVVNLSTRLAGGEKSAVGAVGALGLEVSKLIALGPKEAFIQIAEAAARVENPMQKADIASDLFGSRLSRQLLPVLGELRTKMNDVPQSAIISNENLKASLDFTNNLRNIKDQISTFTVGFLGAMTGLDGYTERLQKANEENAKWIAEAKHFNDLVVQYGDVEKAVAALEAETRKLPEAQAKTISSTDLLNNRLTDLKSRALEPLTLTQQANILVLDKYGIAVNDIAQALGVSTEAVAKFVGEQHKLAEDMKAFGEAWANLNSIGTSYQETLAGIEPHLVAEIKYYIDLGASVEALAQAYPNLTKAQLAAIQASSQAEVESRKTQLETFTLVAKAHGDNINAYIQAEREKFAILVAEQQKAGKFTEQWLADQTAKHKAAVQAEIQSRLEGVENSKAAFEKDVAAAQAKYDLMQKFSSNFTESQIREAARELREKQDRLNHWTQIANDALNSVTDATKENTDKQIEYVDSVAAHWLALAGKIDTAAVKVRTLSGDIISFQEAEARRQAGGSYEINPVSDQEASDFLNRTFGGGSNRSLKGILDQLQRDISKMTGNINAGMWNHQDVSGMMGQRDFMQAVFLWLKSHPNFFQSGVNSFAEGGVGNFGDGTIAMLHGREAVVPLDRNPIMGGGHSMIIERGAFNFNYPMMNDPTALDQIEKLISRALEARLRSMGVRNNSI